MTGEAVADEHADLRAAIQHAVKYYGLDAKLYMQDGKIAELLIDEVAKHLRGETDAQVIERMTEEERSRIGLSA